MPTSPQPPRRRISPNNPVRRRLWVSDADGAKTENFTNALNECFERETQAKSLKWNYDFKNDRPLNHPEGTVEWLVSDGTLIGKIKTPSTVVEIQELNVRELNETTPKVKEGIGRAPVPRKRKSESDSFQANKETRRKISFD